MWSEAGKIVFLSRLFPFVPMKSQKFDSHRVDVKAGLFVL